MSFGITELVLVLVIVLLLFGTTKLKSMGSDLGSAIKGFRSAIDPGDDKSKLTSESQDAPASDGDKTASKVESGKDT